MTSSIKTKVLAFVAIAALFCGALVISAPQAYAIGYGVETTISGLEAPSIDGTADPSTVFAVAESEDITTYTSGGKWAYQDGLKQVVIADVDSATTQTGTFTEGTAPYFVVEVEFSEAVVAPKFTTDFGGTVTYVRQDFLYMKYKVIVYFGTLTSLSLSGLNSPVALEQADVSGLIVETATEGVTIKGHENDAWNDQSSEEETVIANVDNIGQFFAGMNPVLSFVVEFNSNVWVNPSDVAVDFGDNVSYITVTPTKNTHKLLVSVYFDEVAKIKVTAPTIVKKLSYNGEEQVGVNFDEESELYYIADGSVISATDAGTYKAVFMLVDTENYEWDLTKASSNALTLKWTISGDDEAKEIAKTGDSGLLPVVAVIALVSVLGAVVALRAKRQF